MKRSISLVVVLILVQVIFINYLQAQSSLSGIKIDAEYNYLYSTHSTKFRGPSVIVNKDLNKHWNVGLGVGYNTCSYHPDNGYDLKDLKLVPVFAQFKYNFSSDKLIDPYALFKTGITFMDYDQKWHESDQAYYKVHQTGWYTYLGAGVKLNLKSFVQPYFNIGLIGYKMSTNDLDINPHGVAGNLGCSFKL
ncbi:outer membrane beta-barrel protein [Rhizosphaericola mali]|uniref:Outer membrane beta-barrel protein n=1 Tax=Rhizosphaericola mali TaxID=2545455 RepID=A0A5P2G4V1_9BACT|nr:outer membrane beta-barrel protein [Rhizosphaericola mali]QES90846.1 outer membrane beta-barrel protein [Rhizosphaericola mali]